MEEARKLFRLAADVDPQMVHVWQAWGMLELRQGNAQQARQLFQSAVWCNSSNADVCKVWQVRLLLPALRVRTLSTSPSDLHPAVHPISLVCKV